MPKSNRDNNYCAVHSNLTIVSNSPTCSSADGTEVQFQIMTLVLLIFFTPSGPYVIAGGLISGMITGTSYTVLASNGTCSSTASASFT